MNADRLQSIERSFGLDHSHSRLRNLQSSRIRDASYLTIQRPTKARSERTTPQYETNWKFSLETRSEQGNGEEVGRATLESKRSRCAAGIFGLAYGHRALLPGTARDIARVRLRHYKVSVSTTSTNGSSMVRSVTDHDLGRRPNDRFRKREPEMVKLGKRLRSGR